jgi:hypothetical protein
VEVKTTFVVQTFIIKRKRLIPGVARWPLLKAGTEKSRSHSWPDAWYRCLQDRRRR